MMKITMIAMYSYVVVVVVVVVIVVGQNIRFISNKTLL